MTTRLRPRAASFPGDSAAPVLRGHTAVAARPPAVPSPGQREGRLLGRGGPVRPLVAAGLLALMLSGCGIRATQVPTDFGPAPSRAGCALSGEDIATQNAPGVPVQVFVLCSKQLVEVGRTLALPEGAPDAERRVLVAQGLLDELSELPSEAEEQAGYETSVQAGLAVTGPLRDDPEDALRLSAAPEDLQRTALAQIVCTFVDSAAAAEGAGSVVLGGPRGTPLHRYECTSDVRSDPNAQDPPPRRSRIEG